MHRLHRFCAFPSLAALMLLAGDLTVAQPPAADAPMRAGSAPIWPMYRGNPQRTGASPLKGPLPMRVKWQVDLGREICASPAVGADRTIYVGAGAVFYAISRGGRILWSHDFAAGDQYSKQPRRGNATGDNQGFLSPSPALAPDGTIYQSGSAGKGTAGAGFVFALDGRADARQRIRWEYKTNREMRASPLPAVDGCFIGDAILLALDSAGQRRWSGGRSEFSAVTSSPASSRDGQTLYVGGFDGRLHALDASSGAERWTAGPDQRGLLQPPQWNDRGRLARGFTTAGYVPEAPAVGADGTIYFGSWDGHLYAAAPDGRLRWRIDLEDRVTSAPGVGRDGHVVVCTYEGWLCCVRAIGDVPKLEWKWKDRVRYSAPLVSASDVVYVGTLDGKLLAHSLAEGRKLDEVSLGGWIHASPVPVGDGLLVVGGSDGYLRAIETGSAALSPPTTAAADVAEVRAPLATTTLPATPIGGSPASYDDALRLARAYLEEDDEWRRAELLRQVDGWSQRLDEIAGQLRPPLPADAPRGVLAEDKFRLPRVRARMESLRPRPEGPVEPYVPPPGSSLKGPAPDEEYLNWVYVPERYDPRRPLGLVIALHGGAGSSPQSSAENNLVGARGLFGGGDFIIVSPGAPPLVYRWGNSKFCFPESELHFHSIIEDYSARYAIDPNRVYLTGFSMGGIGSWWHAFRHADRFAVIAPQAGMWRAAYWPKLHGTLLYVMSGAFDHHTHIDFARHADARMNELGIAHIDAEYLGAHSPALAQEQREALVELMRTTVRDPYTRRVCAVAPFVPETRADRYPFQPHSFWASVLEAGSSGVGVDYPGNSGERAFEQGGEGSGAWQRRMLQFETRLMKAGALDAEKLDGNRFRVRATNVKRFALWLHPKMGVDFSEPIEIELFHLDVDEQTLSETVRRRQRVVATARPSLGAMLRYLGDRRDFGLIYHAVVEVNVSDGEGARQTD